MNNKIQKIITTMLLFALVTSFFVAMPSIANAMQYDDPDQDSPDSNPYQTWTVEPTCTLEGYTVSQLKATGEEWYFDYVSALGHDFGDFWSLDFSQSRVADVLPFANDPVGTCAVCGWSGYVFQWEITEVAPTCVADGYTKYVASVIPNSGYDFEPWGTAVYDEGSALGHEYDEAVWDGFGYWIVCERCGWQGYLLLEGVTASAFVTQSPGNTNDLTITVTETYSDGYTYDITKTFSIKNNSAGTFTVGHYKVYVDTKGNTQIRACYIVE